MKIALDRLDCRGLALALPRDAPRGGRADPDVVDIARAAHLRGVYEQDATRIHLGAVAATELDVTRACWHLASGRILAPAPASLGDFAIDAEIGRGKLAHGRPRFAGRVAASRGRLGALTVELPSLTASGEVELESAAYKASAGDGSEAGAGALRVAGLSVTTGALRVAADRVEASELLVVWGGKVALTVHAASVVARDVALTVGELVVRADEVRVAELELSRAGGRLSVAAAGATLVGVVVESAGLIVRADELRLPAGARLRDGTLGFAQLDCGEVGVEIAPRPAGKPAKRRAHGASSAFDWSFLDAVEGQLAIDLTVDAKVPLIKRRVATHRFRIAIEGGTIDYQQLERGLSFLEDAILDFAVRRGSLVLELDVPLVPFDNRTLVSWPLDTDGLALAGRNRVRLRTLPGYRLPAAASGTRRKKDTGLELSRLDFDRIDADLRVGGPARIALGDGAITLGRADGPGVGELRVDGTLLHRPGEAQPAELTLEARAIVAAVEALALGRATLHVGRIGVGAVTGGAMTFEGLRPTGGRATLRELALRDGRLDL